jgi:hypothetical protein
MGQKIQEFTAKKERPAILPASVTAPTAVVQGQPAR